jgi:site-specific DNA recombinase
MTKHAAYLGRVSTSNQNKADKHGLPVQKKAVYHYATQNDFIIVADYEDVISGTQEVREGFLRLLDDASRNTFQTVIVYQIDRLGRDERVSYNLLHILEQAGLEIHDTVNGKRTRNLHMAIDIALSAEERRNVLRRTQGGLLGEARNGKLPNGLTTFGYKNLPGQNQATIDHEAASTVRKIFSLSLEGYSLRAIALELKRLEIKTKTGKSWSALGVQRVLSNPAYKGEYYWHWGGEKANRNRYNRDSYGQGKTRYVIQIPAIVDADTWQRAQKKIRGAPAKLGYTLTGHIRCATHDKAMSGRYNQRGHQYYVCSEAIKNGVRCVSGFVRRDVIEEKVEGQLREIFEHPNMLRKIIEQRQPKETDNAKQNKINALESELTRIKEMTRRGIMEFDEAETESKKIKGEIKTLSTLEKISVDVSEYQQKAKSLSLPELLRFANVIVWVKTKEDVRLELKF